MNRCSNLHEIIKFVLVGGIATIIQYALYYCLNSIMLTNFAFAAGYLVSFIFNFIASNSFTFKTKPTVLKGVAFLGSHMLNFSTQWLLLNLFISIGLNKNMALLPVLMIVFPTNFIIVRYVLNSNKL